MAKATGVLVALQSFQGEVDGESFAFRKDDPIEADHPAVAKWPELFGPIKFRFPVKARVEQATAAPGERRGR
jgi:hypothetical protein